MNDRFDPAVDVRIWARNDDGDDYKPLCVDGILAEPKIKSRITHSPEKAKFIVRRAIEVAHVEVLRINRELPKPIADDFKFCSEAAKGTIAMLNRYLEGLGGPKVKCADDLELPILTMQAGLLDGVSAQKLHEVAKREALVLWVARDILRQHADSLTWKDEQVRCGLQNPGKPHHRIFAETLAEAWILLVGEKPGKNPHFNKNPFLRIAAAAWKDVFETVEAEDLPTLFTGALKSIVKWSDRKVAKLRSKGPNWL
jgi:hypothetical protein